MAEEQLNIEEQELGSEELEQVSGGSSGDDR